MFVSPIGISLSGYAGNRNKLNPVNTGMTYTTKFLPFDTVAFGKSEKTLNTQNVQKNSEKHKIFDNYEPEIKDFGDYKIPVHNKGIAERLQKMYYADTFSELFTYAKENGVFDITIDPKTKFVQTSAIQAGENPLMSKLIWVTDSCNFMPLIKFSHPEICVPLMENISKYYAKQQTAFDKIIKDPLLFELNHDWANTAKNGVGHVFNPENNITHKWYARTRLDSLGLYLQVMCDLISDGINDSYYFNEYGYKNSAEISDNAIQSMANATAYLTKIIYPYAKDTGAWEEKTFNSTASSDVAIINEAFRKLIKLMYSPTDNDEILKVRQRLLNAKHGKIFENESELKNMLKLGEYRIRTNSSWEFPTERRYDGAMSFIFATEKLDDDPVKNAKKVLARLKKFETQTSKTKEIVRDNGVLRYTGDTYLYINSDIDYKKPLYHPSPRNFPPKTEAQWFMSSDISKAYGKIVQSLLDKIFENGRCSDDETRSLLNYALTKETEYINRSYARITGENSYKANGKKCPPFKVPEAYQAVTDSNGKIKFVPGTHTPLTWAQVSLYDASNLYYDNVQRYEYLHPYKSCVGTRC